jgi:hypothetical protein
VLVAHGGQKQIQEDRIARKPDCKLAQETPIDPRKSLPRWAADAIGDEDSFLNDHFAGYLAWKTRMNGLGKIAC